MPAVPPCSSMTTAMCACSRCIVASTSSSGEVSGTTGTGGTSSCVERLVGRQQPQQILDVHHADDVIEIAVVYRIPRVTGRRSDGDDVVGVAPNGKADHAHARHHDLAAVSVAELEQLAEHRARLVPQRAALLALLDDDLELLRRVVRARCALSCRRMPSSRSIRLPARSSAMTSG